MSLDADIGNLVASSQALVDTFEGKKEEIEEQVSEALRTVPAATKTYFVDAINGDDANTGTQEAPLKTFTECNRRQFQGGTMTIILLSNYLFSNDEYFSNGYVVIQSNNTETPFTLEFGAETNGSDIRPIGLIPKGFCFVHLRYLNIKLPDISGLAGTPGILACFAPRSSVNANNLSLKISYCDLFAPAETLPLTDSRFATIDIIVGATTFTNMAGNWLSQVAAGTDVLSISYLKVMGLTTL